MSDSRTIQDLLDRVKFRIRWLTVARVGAGLVAAVLAAVAVEIALDQLVALPRWIRMLAFLGGLTAVGMLGRRLLSGPLAGRVNDLYAARSIEGRYAHLKSGLITYVQLPGDEAESAALREFVGERVAQDLGTVRPEVVVPSRGARRRALQLAGAVAGLLLLFAISPSGFWRSFQRAVLPIRNLAETRIVQVVPGNFTTYKGKDLEIAVRLEGKFPPSARLRVARGSGDPLSIELPVRTDGWARAVLPGITEGFAYSISAHDALSDEYRVRVAEVPRLRTLAATLRFPKYTGFPGKTQDSGTIDALEGTEVTLEGVATRPLRSAAMSLKGSAAVAASVRGDRFALSFTVTETRDYAVELTDTDGVADPEPSRFRVVARKDAPPQVTLTVPGKNVEVPEPMAVRLAYRLVDDFGFTAVKLTAKVNGKQSRTMALPVPRERLAIGEAALDLKALGAGPGDYVEYAISATDNKEPTPQTGESAAYVVTIQTTLPLLTFADAHPDVRVEKYRDPWDRKGSVEPRSDRSRADDRTREEARSQEPARRDPTRKDVAKVEEKKPEAAKTEPGTEEARKTEPDSGREDALSKLLEEKKDLVDKLLAKAGGSDAAGDRGRSGRDPSGATPGDSRDGGQDGAGGTEKGAGAKDADRDTPDGAGEARKGGTPGSKGAARDAKGARRGEPGGEGASAGDEGGDGQAGENGGETAKAGASGSKPGAGKGGKPGKPGKPGSGRNGGGDGEGGDGDDGDDDGDDTDDDYDLADLFPFSNPGGT